MGLYGLMGDGGDQNFRTSSKTIIHLFNEGQSKAEDMRRHFPFLCHKSKSILIFSRLIKLLEIQITKGFPSNFLNFLKRHHYSFV